MNYLPHHFISYQTKLESQEVLQRLDEVVEPYKTWRWKGIWKEAFDNPYEGKITGQTFEISRLTNYKNSFKPIIKGKVKQKNYGTLIEVELGLHLIVKLIGLFWLGGVFLGFLAFYFSAGPEDGFEPLALIPLAMIAFAYIIMMIAFQYEVKKTSAFFEELWSAKIVN